MATSTIKKDTEWAKKSGDIMTGNLCFAYANMLSYGEQTTRRWLLYPNENLSSFLLATQELVNGEWANWKGVINAHADGSIEINQPLGVDQGGTGARTPAQACANIGAVKKGSFTSTLLYSGVPAVNATFTLNDYIGNYNILRIVDAYHYECDVYMPVFTSTQTIMANGSTSFPYDGIPRFLLWEFTATSSDGINYTVARKAQANIASTGVEVITTNAEFGIHIYGLR